MEQERARVKYWRFWSVYKRCYLVLLVLEMLTYDKAFAASTSALGNISATIVDYTSITFDVLILTLPLAFAIWGIQRRAIDFLQIKFMYRSPSTRMGVMK